MTPPQPLHPIDPRDEVRLCEWVRRDNPCPEHGPDCRGYVVGRWDTESPYSGTLGVDRIPRFIPATDQRVIDVRYAEEDEMFVAFCDDSEFRALGQPFILASQPTEAQALLAARCAVWGIELEMIYHFYYWRETGGHVPNKRDGFTDPEAALCAAIDARKEPTR